LCRQGRQPLDFVDDDPGPPILCLDLAPERFRIAREIEKRGGAQQVEPECVGQDVAKPRRLAGPPRSEEKE
jgi:hypothetical protein